MFLQQANTLFTLYLSKWINTGDKLQDSTLVGLCVVGISFICAHLASNWKEYYNLVIFYMYKMYRNPTHMWSAPYIIDNYRFEHDEDFRCKTSQSVSAFSFHDINDALKDRGSQKFLNDDHDKRRLIEEYFLDKGIQYIYLRNKGGRPITMGNWNDYVHPVAVSNRGNVVYYESFFEEFRAASINRNDTMYIRKHFAAELARVFIEKKGAVGKDNIFVAKYRKSPNSDGPSLELKNIGKINKKKTFDALYYPQKSELISMLQKFQAGALYPAHVPMDNKLGILLYGPPGTGKTGTISAVANMLGRSIMIINFAEITTCQQLDEIMDPQKYSEYIYVFDEFDCVLDVISGVKGGGEKKKESAAANWGNMLLFAEGEERKSIIEAMKSGRSHKEDAPIDMAYLLQKFDGLESAENRIIIATTNNPDKINPALLRPGRFDIKICLGLCSPQMIADILTNFYKGGEKMRAAILAAGLPGNKYSPLQLINMALQTPSFEKLVKRLRAC